MKRVNRYFQVSSKVESFLLLLRRRKICPLSVCGKNGAPLENGVGHAPLTISNVAEGRINAISRVGDRFSWKKRESLVNGRRLAALLARHRPTIARKSCRQPRAFPTIYLPRSAFVRCEKMEYPRARAHSTVRPNHRLRTLVLLNFKSLDSGIARSLLPHSRWRDPEREISF